MKLIAKKAATLSRLISLQLVLGCAQEQFPQYSGRYQLGEHGIYSDASFAGKKHLPWDLTITHRMNYYGNSWDDLLRFEFTSPNPNLEIQGAVVFDLEHLSSINETSFPHEEFKGEKIHEEHEYYGGAFCNYQYQYHAFAVLTPGEIELQKVYPNKGEYLKTENGMPLHESINPDTFEPDPEAIDRWYGAIENNDAKITLELYLSRNLQDTYSGCDEYSYLPYDSRREESLSAVYFSTELHDQEDPRIGFDELLENRMSAIDLFKEVISGVKDL